MLPTLAALFALGQLGAPTLVLLAQALPPNPDQLDVFLRTMLDAAMAGRWSVVVALGLVAAVWLLRRAPWPFLKTGEGGALLTIVTSFVGAFATAVIAGAAITGSLLWSSLQVALLAAGGWSLVKHLLPLLMKVPFLAKLFARGDAATAISTAEKKGLAAAVVAKPPKAEDIANGP